MSGGVALEVEGGGDLSFDAWERRSNAVARGLVARGVGAGEPVGLLFPMRHWAGFAVAQVGVRKAGAYAALFSPGAGPAELRRALAQSRATGVLSTAPVEGPAWVASPDDVAQGWDTSPLAPVADAGAVAYPPAPLGRAEPVTVAGAPIEVDGRLVHAWAPGSPAGQQALDALRSGRCAGLATVADFDPVRVRTLAERVGATALGLTPALAAALLAAGPLPAVPRLILSGRPSDALLARLARVEVTVLDGPAPPPVVGDAAPVAVSQEGMLWHEQFAPGSFNLPALVRRYEGPLVVAAFEWALSELVRRHEPLRSTFRLVDGEPRQVVGAPDPVRLPVVDLGHEQAAQLIAEAGTRPFDLVEGPLFDPRLVRLGPEDHLLVVRVHHTVFDDWSVDLFRRELSALYSSRVAGEPSPLVEAELSFSGFCRRQRARLAGPEGEEERAWWRTELQGAPFAVQLPIGPGRPGEPVRVPLPAALAADVRALAPTLRATPFMTVLAAFSVLLSRKTGQDDLLIATVVAHRNRSDVEPLIGCFTKKVPLRLRVGGEPTFAELVSRTRGSLLGSLSHQGTAFDAAVEEGVGRAAAAHGVVPQVAVVFQGEAPQRVRISLRGLRVSHYEATRHERHFSARDDADPWGGGIYLGTFLILSLEEGDDGMALVARGAFDRPAADRLVGELVSLLEHLVAAPSQPVPVGGRMVDEGAVDVRGFRADRSQLEAALAGCPGVAKVTVAVQEVDGEPRLTASVVPEADDAPTLAVLRQALWAALPGVVWPAEVAGVAPAGPEPLAAVLAAMWAETRGRPVGTDACYWQDFSFLPVLAEARAAGLAVDDEAVVRCRTLETLAVAVAAR